MPRRTMMGTILSCTLEPRPGPADISGKMFIPCLIPLSFLIIPYPIYQFISPVHSPQLPSLLPTGMFLLCPHSGCEKAFSVYSIHSIGSAVNPSSSWEHGQLCVTAGDAGPSSLPQPLPHLYLQICDVALKESAMTHCLSWTYWQ